MEERKIPVRIAVLGTSMLLMGIERMLENDQNVQVEKITRDYQDNYCWEGTDIDVLIHEQPAANYPGLEDFLAGRPGIKTIQVKMQENKIVVSMQRERNLFSLEDLIDVIQREGE